MPEVLAQHASLILRVFRRYAALEEINPFAIEGNAFQRFVEDAHIDESAGEHREPIVGLQIVASPATFKSYEDFFFKKMRERICQKLKNIFIF